MASGLSSDGGEGSFLTVVDYIKGRVEVPEDTMVNMGVQGFWKKGMTALFKFIIVNLYVGSYLCIDL